VTAIGGHRLFENGIEVQGFIWECERSESHTLWLLWQVLWQQPGDTHFSVRVRDQGGALLAQADASGYPSAYRRKGDRVLSGFESQLDVSQSLFVSSARVGVYRFPQVENLRVLDGSGNPVDDGILLDLRQPLE
jgi:hypothetical protein